MARGFAGEVRHYLLLAVALGYAAKREGERLRAEYVRVLQMLTNLAKSLSGKRTGQGI